MITLIAQVDTGLLNHALSEQLAVIHGGMAALQGTAHSVLIGLATIEIAMIGISTALGGDTTSAVEAMLKKGIAIAVFAFAIGSWGSVSGSVQEYFSGPSVAVGGASASQVNPSQIAESGVHKVAFIFSPEATNRIMRDGMAASQQVEEGDGGYLSSMWSSGKQTVAAVLVALLFMVLALLIIFAHFYVAIQVYLVTLEFHLIATFAVLLLPFGVNRHTSWLANQAFSALIAQSVRLGVLLLLVSMLGPVVQRLQFATATPTLYEALSMLLAVATMAFAVHRTPSIAASAFSGAGGGIDISGVVASAASVATAAAMPASVGGLPSLDAGGERPSQLAGGEHSAHAAPEALGAAPGDSAGDSGTSSATSEPPVFKGGLTLVEPSPAQGGGGGGGEGERAQGSGLRAPIPVGGSASSYASLSDVMRSSDPQADEQSGPKEDARPDAQTGADTQAVASEQADEVPAWLHEAPQLGAPASGAATGGEAHGEQRGEVPWLHEVPQLGAPMSSAQGDDEGEER